MTAPTPKTDIEALDCNGALGVVIHRTTGITKGRQLAEKILAAAREQTPNLVHPDAYLP